MVSGLRMVLESLCCFKILCSKSKMTPPIVIERTPSIEEQVGKMYITQSFFKTVLFFCNKIGLAYLLSHCDSLRNQWPCGINHPILCKKCQLLYSFSSSDTNFIHSYYGIVTSIYYDCCSLMTLGAISSGQLSESWEGLALGFWWIRQNKERGMRSW